MTVYKSKPAPLGTSEKVLTLISTLICIFTTCFIPLFLNIDLYLILLTYIIIWGPYIAILYLIPRFYSISSQGLVIHRLFNNVSYNRDNILEVNFVEHLKVESRILGSEGLFGYLGRFALSNNQFASLYCTRLNNIITIKYNDKIIVISPSDPLQFLEKWKTLN